jgi:hypothetical protein
MSAISGGPLGATRGLLWSLSSGKDSDDDKDSNDGSDNGSDEGNVEDSPVGISLEALSAYCKTPDAELCTLPSSTSSAVHWREQKKIQQREAAIQLRPGTPCSPASSVSTISKFAAKTRKVQFESPVISPTTFLLESFDAVEWVVVQRRRRKNRFWRRRGVCPPARSDQPSWQRSTACDRLSKNDLLGHLGSVKARVNAKILNDGRMGHGLAQVNRSRDCIPQFARGL